MGQDENGSTGGQQLPDDLARLGWVIEGRCPRRSIGYWLLFVLGLFFETATDAPDITYMLRNQNSGARRRVTLPADHSPAELAAAVRAACARAA